MPFIVHCPYCHSPMTVPDHLPGTAATCAHCRRPITLPAGPAPAAPPQMVPPTAQPTAPVQPAAPTPPDAPTQAAPTTPPRRRRSPVVAIVLVVVVLGLLGGGAYLVSRLGVVSRIIHRGPAEPVTPPGGGDVAAMSPEQERALANLKCWCRHEIGRAIQGFYEGEIRELATKSPLGQSDYWIYVVVPGAAEDSLVPYRGGQLKSAEVVALADFLSKCPESTIVSTSEPALEAIYYMGGGLADEIGAAPILADALQECTRGKGGERVYLRFMDETHQLVVSFSRDMKLSEADIALHPDWRP